MPNYQKIYKDIIKEIISNHNNLLTVSTELLQSTLAELQGRLIVEEEMQKFYKELKSKLAEQLEEFGLSDSYDINQILDTKNKEKIFELIEKYNYFSKDIQLDDSVLTSFLLKNNIKLLQYELEYRKLLKTNLDIYNIIHTIMKKYK